MNRTDNKRPEPDDMLDEIPADELIPPPPPPAPPPPTYEIVVESLEAITKDGAIANGSLVDPSDRNKPFRLVQVRVDGAKARELAETFVKPGHGAGPIHVTLDKIISIGRLER